MVFGIDCTAFLYLCIPKEASFTDYGIMKQKGLLNEPYLKV